MTVQWRAKDKGGKDWDEWVDIYPGEVARFNASLPSIEELQVREKPAAPPFQPGWYWATTDEESTPIPFKRRLIEWLEKESPYQYYNYEQVKPEDLKA